MFWGGVWSKYQLRTVGSILVENVDQGGLFTLLYSGQLLIMCSGFSVGILFSSSLLWGEAWVLEEFH